MALPAVLAYGRVTWRAVTPIADGLDDGGNPDARPVTGDVTFTPSATVLLANDTPPVTVLAVPITYTLDEQGVLRDSHGDEGITLVATDSPNVSPVGWTWSVSYRLNGGAARGGFAFALPGGSTVDLTSVAPVGTSGGVQITRGPKGDPGLGVPVVISDDPNYPRPDTQGPVLWFGPTEFTNTDDLLDVYVPVQAD